ncbi:MAG: beta galactosidase jelly roll domain-containing protein, partial [Aquisalinus sp.]|nr:beta galactosidase jelly roll domain-containing protein [Aquisalinus sp.]
MEKDLTEETSEEDPFKRVDLELPEAEPVMGFLSSRKVQSLNGEWRAIVDPMGVGNPNPLSPGFFKDAQNISGMELIEYDFDTALSLRVPGDWNSQFERLFFYQGQVWYRKKFVATQTNNERYHLHFGAANFHAQVFLNGEPIGQHQGGYVPFSFDVTKHLKDGENTLVVRVDNTLDDSTIPTARTDWWPYGGLTRDVSLISTPRAFIRNAKIELTDRDIGEITFQIFTEGYKAGSKATVAITELELQSEVEIDREGVARGAFTADLELWLPDNPKLYEVNLSAGSDAVVEKVGFRTIETDGTQILLNGTPIKFRGISTHEEPIGASGVAYSRDHVLALLEEAKNLNVNFVRAAHYPYSRYMAEVADELGLLLWEEIPVYWSIDWQNEETLSIARDQMERLVQRDWNRASVVIWSVANETPSSPDRLEFLLNLIEHTRNMDQSRLVSAALLGGSRKSFEEIITHLAVRGLAQDNISMKDRAVLSAIKLRAGLGAPKPDDTYTVVIDDPLGELVDIVSYNEYFGWYYSMIFARETNVSEGLLRNLMLDFMPDMRIRASVEKPVHISEFGAGAKYGL